MTQIMVLPAETAGPKVWAAGCGQCVAGILAAPPIPKTTSSVRYIREQQALAGLIMFCDCPAGQAYERLVFRNVPPEQYADPRQLEATS